MLSHFSICNSVDTRNKHLQLFHPASLFFAFVLLLLFLSFSTSSTSSSFLSSILVLRPLSLFFILFPCSLFTRVLLFLFSLSVSSSSSFYSSLFFSSSSV